MPCKTVAYRNGKTVWGKMRRNSFVQHCLQQLQSHRGFTKYLFYFSCTPSFPPYTFSLQYQGKAHWHRSYISKAARYFLKFILLVQSIFKVFIFLEIWGTNFNTLKVFPILLRARNVLCFNFAPGAWVLRKGITILLDTKPRKKGSFFWLRSIRQRLVKKKERWKRASNSCFVLRHAIFQSRPAALHTTELRQNMSLVFTTYDHLSLHELQRPLWVLWAKKENPDCIKTVK